MKAVLGLIALLCCLASVANASTPDQLARWKAAKLDPRRSIELDKLVDRWRQTSARYDGVQRMVPNGVPAAVAFCLFYRECDNDFRCSPAQGDRLDKCSVNEPRGRIPGKTPPFLWSDAAYDAYYVVDHLDRTRWGDVPLALDKIESFNGFGYRAKGVAAPYLWAGTTLYGINGAPAGKYVRDGVFDRSARDKQLGVAAIMLRMRERGIILPF